jgi:hypothetical protein
VPGSRDEQSNNSRLLLVGGGSHLHRDRTDIVKPGVRNADFSDQSGLAPENLITLAHFSVSSAMSLTCHDDHDQSPRHDVSTSSLARELAATCRIGNIVLADGSRMQPIT